MYSAGTIFLDVAPSFRGVQNEVDREVRKAVQSVGKDLSSIGPDFEKKMGEAGEKAGKNLANSFSKVTQDRFKRMSQDLDVLNRSLGKGEVKAFREEMERIGKLDLKTITGQAEFLQGMRDLRGEWQRIINEGDQGQRRLGGQARTMLGALRAQADEIDKTVRRWNQTDPDVQLKIRVDRDAVQADMRRLRDEIRMLASDVKIDVDLDAGAALAQVTAMRAALDQIAARAVDLDVDVDVVGAVIQLRTLEASLRGVGREAVKTNRLMKALDAGSAANSVRVFNGALLATLALGPALIPVLAGVAAGIFGIGAAALGALAGIGVLVAAFSGIGGAVTAMNDLARAQRLDKGGTGSGADALAAQRRAVQDARALADAQRNLARARRDAAEQIENADRRVQEAEEAVADAHRAAARAAREAAERVKDAEARLADSQERAREAQEGLNDARRQAVRDLEDLNNQLDSARLNERGLEFALEEALVHLNVVLEDDQATEREKAKAQLAYEKALEALEQQQLETKRLESDTKKANKEGVEGSDRVKDAKDRLKRANDEVKDSEDGLTKARRAQVEQAADSAERINDAEAALARAREDRARAEVDAAESIADAQRNLARAHEDARLRAQESAQATDSLATATDNLNEALRGLSPAGVAFATWLFGLKPLLDELRFAVQEGFLPGLQRGLQLIVETYGPSFIRFMGGMARVAGRLAETFAQMLVTPQWKSFFALLGSLAPIFLEQFGEISINILTGFMEIMRAFLPFMVEMGEAFSRLSGSFADWAATLADSTGFAAFLDYLRQAGPEVAELFGNLGDIFVNLLIGLAPYADKLLEALIGFTAWLADMEPSELAALALGIGAVVLAIQALAGFLSVFAGVGGLITSVAGVAAFFRTMLTPLGQIVTKLGLARGAAGLLGKGLGLLLGPIGMVISIAWLLYDAFTWLYQNVDWFRQGVDTAVDAIGTAFSWLWENILSPVFRAIAGAWDWLWKNVFKPTWENVIRPIVQLLGGVFNVLGQIFARVFDAMSQIIRFVVVPVFRWFWENIVRPIFRSIGAHIEFVWTKVMRPVFRAIGGFIEEHIAPAWRKAVAVLGDIWGGILDLLRTPIRLGIEYVLNKGLIAAFNWLADKVPGMTPLKPIEIPAALQPGGGRKPGSGGGGKGYSAYATGGVLPGYTPGRDVHRFYSDTAGVLDLSGGEGIARPELVAAIGHARWNAANKAAREGRLEEGLGYLGGFARGGILGNIGGFLGDTWTKITAGARRVGDALGGPVEWFKKQLALIAKEFGIDGIPGDAVLGVARKVPAALGNWVRDLVVPQGAKGGGKGRPLGKGTDLGSMMAMVKSLIPGVLVTSSFRPGAITASGYPSLHGLGRAMDLVGGPGLAGIFNILDRTFGIRGLKELYYSPMGNRQIHRDGRRYDTSPVTKAGHFDHVHMGWNTGGIIPTLYDQGGDLPPGLSLIANKTQKPESIVTNRFVEEVRAMSSGRGDGPLVDARGSHFGADADEVAHSLNKMRSDQLALAGIFDEPGVM